MKTSYKHGFLDNESLNSLEKARFWEVVMDNGMYEGTDTSVSNYISNILTLHILLYSIINNELVSTTASIILSVFFKKAHFLLWLILSHTEAFARHFCYNIINFEEIIVGIRKNMKNADISAKTGIRGGFRQVKKSRFRSKTMLNLVKPMFMLLFPDISAKNGIKMIALKFDRSMTTPDLVKFVLMASTTDNSTKNRFLEERPQFDRSMTKYEGELR